MGADDLLQQQIEVAVTGQQHHFVHPWRGIQYVDGDADIPVTLGRAVGTLDVGLQLHRETEVAQNLLELLLTRVAAVDGVGIGLDDAPAASDVCPQGGVVEMAAVGLAHGVVEVLHIGEDSDLLRRGRLGTTQGNSGTTAVGHHYRSPRPAT